MMSDKVLLYLDNSNIYFGSQLYSGKVKNFKEGISDVNCRMRLEVLLQVVLAGRIPDIQKAYGKMSNEVCDLLKKQGFEVSQSSSSSYSSREKEADTQLMADAVEDIIIKRPNAHKPHGGTVVLMSGDQDMCPLIKKSRKYGWNVEIWAFAGTLASTIKTEAERKEDGTTVTIKSKEMETKFGNYTHTVRKEWNAPIPPNRTLLLVFKNGKEWISDLSEESKQDIETSVIDTGNAVFQLPIATKFLPGIHNRDRNVSLAVIVMLSEFNKSSTRNYDFEMDIWQHRFEFTESVGLAVKSRFGGRKSAELKVIKYEVTEEPIYNRNTNNGSSKKFPENNWRRGESSNSSNNVSPSRASSQVDKKGIYCRFKINCNHESTCKYAHSKLELQCANCGKAGDHTSAKCPTQNRSLNSPTTSDDKAPSRDRETRK